jgi:hypothetical protein
MAKISNGTILNLVKWAAVIIFSAGSVYAVVHYRLNTVEGDVKRIKETALPDIGGDIEYHDDRLYEQEKEVFGLKKEFGHLADKVDRNFKDQQDFQVEQKLVQKEILDGIKELHK